MEIQVLEMTPFAMNCLVVKEGGEALVIDPGEEHPAIKAAVADCKVKMVVNTHCHIDHCGGNAGIVAATGAPLACHEADVPLLENLLQQAQMFGVPSEESPPPDRLLAEGDTVNVGGTAFEVLHTPGHSPGHIVLVTDGIAIVGDVLFMGSIGRTDLPGGSMEQLLDSIRTKLLPLPDDTVVYSGHGPATTIGRERATNPFLV